MPLILCSLEDESSSQFLLHCHYDIDNQKTLFHELQSVDENMKYVERLFYDSKKFNFQQNCSLLKSAVKFILKLERFNGSML